MSILGSTLYGVEVKRIARLFTILRDNKIDHFLLDEEVEKLIQENKRLRKTLRLQELNKDE